MQSGNTTFQESCSSSTSEGDGNDGNWHELEEFGSPVEQQGIHAGERQCEQSTAGKYPYELLEEGDAAAPQQSVSQSSEAFEDYQADSAGAEANTGPNSVNLTARTESNALSMDSQRKAAILRAMKDISISFVPHWAIRLSERQWSEAINSMAAITTQEQPDN